MSPYLPLFILLVLIAAILRQTTVLTILYLIGGIFLVGRWWSRRALHNITVQRDYPSRVFLDQSVTVRMLLQNAGWLPVVWVKLHESLPVGMVSPNYYQRILSIRPRGKVELEYHLNAHKRGYYSLGPLFLSSGDLLGLSEEQQRVFEADSLIVYPQIVSLTALGLPSRSPFGSIHETNPLFEDPSRPTGKRDLIEGNSMRRVDWKATASVGRLQVKQYEPSIALETVLYLNLHAEEYESRHRMDLTELAIVVAASIAVWSAKQKHPTGLVTNGLDPIGGNHIPQAIPPRKGSAQLTQLLDLLARIESGDSLRFADLLRQRSAQHSWGTTLILITGALGDPLLDELFPIRRRGMNVVLVPVGPVQDISIHRQRAEHFGFQVHPVRSLLELERFQ